MRYLIIIVIIFITVNNKIQVFSKDWEILNSEINKLKNTLAVDSNDVIYIGTNLGFYSYFKKYSDLFFWDDNIWLTVYINGIKIERDYSLNTYSVYVLNKSGVFYIDKIFWAGIGKVFVINPTSILFNRKNECFVSAIGDIYNGGVRKKAFINEDVWIDMNNGLPVENDSIKALDIVNKNDTLFVALSNGLYYSTNEGELWLPVSYFDGLEVDKFVLNTKNDLYFIVSGTGEKSGLYKNNVKIFDVVLPLSSVAINRNDDVFASSSIKGKGVFWTSDYGTEWQEMYNGLDSCEVTALICDLDGYIYAGTNGQGIYKSIKSTTGVINNKHFKNRIELSPNPFSEKTKISFNHENPAYTKLTIYNSLGYIIDVIADEFLSEGNQEFTFDGSALASGTYYYVLQAGGRVETGKLVLIK